MFRARTASLSATVSATGGASSFHRFSAVGRSLLGVLAAPATLAALGAVLRSMIEERLDLPLALVPFLSLDVLSRLTENLALAGPALLPRNSDEGKQGWTTQL